jgi:CRP/FNR family cyclic AMP-dependent transcriptional regulator
MDELDFSNPGVPKPASPKPAAAPPAPLYNAATAMEFFRCGGKPEAVSAGTTFFSENEKAGFLKRDKMYLVLEGEVALMARGKPVGLVKVGEIFGEMAAITDSPRTATALARTACRVIALDDKEFQKALKLKPEFALMLMSIMIGRLRAMLIRLAQNNALGGAEASKESRVFDKAMLAALSKGLGEDNTGRYQEGRTIFREGGAGILMYVVLEGRVAISIKGNIVERVGPGGVFGEMALVDQSVRAATATAEADCVVLGINRHVFLNLVKAHPDFGASLLGSVAERVRFMASRFR